MGNQDWNIQRCPPRPYPVLHAVATYGGACEEEVRRFPSKEYRRRTDSRIFPLAWTIAVAHLKGKRTQAGAMHPALDLACEKRNHQLHHVVTAGRQSEYHIATTQE